MSKRHRWLVINLGGIEMIHACPKSSFCMVLRTWVIGRQSNQRSGHEGLWDHLEAFLSSNICLVHLQPLLAEDFKKLLIY